MAKIVLVIAKDGFRDEEFFVPKTILEKSGHGITIASTKAGACKGKLGGKAIAAISLKDLDPESFDAVAFIGGGGAQVFFDDPEAHRIARDLFIKRKVVAAICIGPSILANAGILRGRRATAYRSEEKNLREKGATYTGEDLVSDSNIITANGPAAAQLFGEKIAELLKGK